MLLLPEMDGERVQVIMVLCGKSGVERTIEQDRLHLPIAPLSAVLIEFGGNPTNVANSESRTGNRAYRSPRHWGQG